MAGCGFEPLHAPRSAGDSVSDLLAQVQISEIANREGQILRNNLVNSFYVQSPSALPLYRLDVDLATQLLELNVRADDETTRQQLRLDARYVLTDLRAETVVYTDSARILSAVNLTDEAYASFSTEREATTRSLRELSDLITLRVASFLRRSA